MNAPKPQAARSAQNPKPAPVSARSGSRLREAAAAAVKVGPAELAADNDDDDDGADSLKSADFEHHDTIPAPTWFDDGGESSSS